MFNKFQNTIIRLIREDNSMESTKPRGKDPLISPTCQISKPKQILLVKELRTLKKNVLNKSKSE